MVKNLPANATDGGSIPGSGRSLGERNGNALQDSCLGNAMDRGAWWDYNPQGCKRFRLDLVTKQEQQHAITIFELGFKLCVYEGFPAC